MDHHDSTRKAAGSSDRGRRQHRTSSSASRPQQKYERPQESPYSEDGQPHARTRPLSERPEAPHRRVSEPASRLHTEYSQGESFSSEHSTPLKKQSSGTSEEWDMLEEQQQDVFGIPLSIHAPPHFRYAQSAALASSPTPSYDFPGTWPAALHDTTSALTQVGSATASYATALTQSGIGKAGWSVGAAFASTANKRALSFVDWATDHTETGADQLPRPIAGWLKSGKEKMEEKRRAERQKRERKARRARGERTPDGWDADRERDQTFQDEQGSFVLETSEMDSTGEFVSESPGTQMKRSKDNDGFTVASTQGGSLGKGKGRAQRDDYEADEETEPEDDGLTRLFEFDD